MPAGSKLIAEIRKVTVFLSIEHASAIAEIENPGTSTLLGFRVFLILIF
jgi:hypothetical protein